MLGRMAVTAVAVVSATGVAMTGAQASGLIAARAGTTTGGPAAGTQGSRPMNVYQAGPSVPASCGDTIGPFRQVRLLPGGGESYNYGNYARRHKGGDSLRPN